MPDNNETYSEDWNRAWEAGQKAQMEKKAKAYDDYLEKVDKGEIVVLTPDELNELAELMDPSMSLCNERVIKFLEEHSHWKWPGHD